MAAPAAVLQVLVTANTKQANAALAQTQAQLQATQATAAKTSAATGAAVAKGVARGATAMAALGGGAIVAAAKWEDAFADVRKTVDSSEAGFKRMETGLRNLAKTIPVSATELAHLAGEAGALGVAAKDIVGFTKVAAQLGTATDMSASDAANSLARLGNIMRQKTVNDFERMGATLVDLGNKGASTEGEISAMALRIAGAGKTLGLSAAQVLGLSASLANLGIRAEMGGSAISRVMLEMQSAVASGGEILGSFGDIAGVSAEKFAKAFGEDPTRAIQMFTDGLNRINKGGGDMKATLDKVGLGEIRVRDTLLRLAGAQDEVTRGQEIANRAWGENSALTEEANKRYKTTSSQFQILKNRIFDVGIALGQDLLPKVNEVMEALGKGDLGGAISAMAKLGVEMGAKLASGLLQGFAQADILGKLAIAALVTRVIGGKGAIVAAGMGVGRFLGIGIGAGATSSAAAAMSGQAGAGVAAGAAGGGLLGKLKSIKWGRVAGLGIGIALADSVISEFTRQMQTKSTDIFAALEAKSKGPSFLGFELDTGGLNQGLLDMIGITNNARDKAKELTAALKGMAGPGGTSADALRRLGKDAGFSDAQMEALGVEINRVSQQRFQQLQNQSKHLRDQLTSDFKNVRGAGISNTKQMADQMGVHWKHLRDMLTGVADDLQLIVFNTLKALGVDPKSISALVGRTSLIQGKQKGDPGGFQKGGVIVPGFGSGDKVRALLEPGEVVLNRQAVKALGGASMADSINKAIPRFAKGGPVTGSVIGGAGGARGVMVAGVKADVGAANDLIEEAKKKRAAGSAAGSRDIVELGRALQREGYTVGEHPAFGGVSGVHVAGSYHYRGRALDINADSMPGGEMANLDRLNKQLMKNPKVVELLWRVANHFDHLHVAMQQGGIVQDFARAGVDTKATKRAMYALFMAGMAESGMRDLGYGDASSQGVLQLLASTARSTGINPHDEYGVAKGFLTRGYWGKGGAINLAKQGVAPAMIAHLVQGNATGTDVYSAQGGAARNLLQSSGLRFPPGGKGAATLAKANVPPKVKPEKGKTKDAEWALTYTPKMLDRINRLGGDAGLIAMAADFASRAASLDTAVGGKDEAGWLNEQLAHMITLRNLLIDAYLWVQEVIRRYQEAIDAAQKQLKKINDSLKGKRITASAGLTKKRDDLKAQIAKWKSRRDASAAFLAGDDGPIARLDTLQGFVNPESLRFAKAASLAVGPYGGQIAEVQGSLKSLGENAADTGASDTSSATDNSAMIALLQEQANNLAKQLFVSEQSFKVLSQTPGPPYVGSFAQGGIVPGSGPKLATVHGGEHIGQPSPIVILVQDGAVNADRIRAISGRQAEQMARRAGRGRIPGRAGSMG
jgi:TP901 family phage tail tape measure protein